jgi:hypothetical protein
LVEEDRELKGRGFQGRRVDVLGGLVGVLLLLVLSVPSGAAAATDCQFVLGFATLHQRIPTVVGQCIAPEQYAGNGDGLQPTTNGLPVWRKADNFTAFTDGHRTWVNGPLGVQERLNTQRFDWEKQATVAATQVIRLTVPTPSAQGVSGYCWVPSLASNRPDAWRCMVGNGIYDPCFSAPNQAGQVVCVPRPSDPSMDLTIDLTRPLPAPNPPTAMPHAWFLTLADGSECGFLTGATGGVRGQRINYGCTDGWDVVGDPQPGPVWTATEYQFAPMSFTPQKQVTVQIASVWE